MLEVRYPSHLDIAVEILSDDQASYIHEKCLHYSEAGTPQILVFDPKLQTIRIWNNATQSLDLIEDLHLNNGAVIREQQTWSEFEQRLH